MRTLLWIIFIALVIIMKQQDGVIEQRTQQNIGNLELARYQGRSMLELWNSKTYGKGTLVDVARVNTHWDFFFILTYVSLMILCSYSQMQNERFFWLNALLRLNLLLAVIAGLLDVTENLILLYDFRHVNEPALYQSSYWVSLPKWLLIAWVLLVWIVSLVKSGIQFLLKPKSPKLTRHIPLVN